MWIVIGVLFLDTAAMSNNIQGFCRAKKTRSNEDTILFKILKTYMIRFFHFDYNCDMVWEKTVSYLL